MLLHRKIPGPVACLVIAGLLGAIGVWMWQARRSGQSQRTFRVVQSFAMSLGSHSGLHGRIPGPSLQDAVNELLREERFAGTRVAWRWVVRGTDAWGRPFIYEWHPGGGRAIIRSAGPNGTDEGGAGDDIQAVISIE